MDNGAQKRVLVIDDATLVRLFYREALERSGFRVEESLNGLEALEKLLIGPFDLLIVDVNMPQMDGLTFVSTVRGKPMPMSATPVLITSTEAEPRRVAAARAAGANFYLIKPLSQDVLVQFASLLCGVSNG